MSHFEVTFSRDELGRFILHLPKKNACPRLGESRTMAIKRFIGLERSLKAKGQFEEFAKEIKEYFELDHAEVVPSGSILKPHHDILYADGCSTKIDYHNKDPYCFLCNCENINRNVVKRTVHDCTHGAFTVDRRPSSF